jgi:hypothetical protein
LIDLTHLVDFNEEKQKIKQKINEKLKRNFKKVNEIPYPPNIYILDPNKVAV